MIIGNKKKYHQQGFSVVEIIISLAVIAMLAIYIIPFLTNSFLGISNIGNRSKALYQAQNVLENLTDKNNTAGTGKKIIINNEWEIEGKIKTVAVPVNNNSIKLFIFVAD